MIFVTLGSQKFQFNRLLRKIDMLVEEGVIKEEIFAQIGYSDYIPKHYSFKNFLDRDEFLEIMNKCDKIITHGGTGAIIGAVKKNKKVIAVPRSSKFKEHVDEHQHEIVNEFSNMNLIYGVQDVVELDKALYEINHIEFSQYESHKENLMESIERFIEQF